MTVRADHVAGAIFVALGLIVFVIGHDLPFGDISAPSAGMMPKLAAGLMIVFALAVMLRAPDSPPFASIDWSDRWHALQLVVITAVAVMLYRKLGFLITMAGLVFTLLVVVERRRLLPASLYAVGLAIFSYWLFGKALKSPLERGLLWF